MGTIILSQFPPLKAKEEGEPKPTNIINDLTALGTVILAGYLIYLFTPALRGLALAVTRR